VIQMAKAQYPLSAQLGHPENEELMPLWGQVVLAGLTRAPDHAGSNPNTRSHPTHHGFGESEFEHPEFEHPEFGDAGHAFAHNFGFNTGFNGAFSGGASGGEQQEQPEQPEQEGNQFNFNTGSGSNQQTNQGGANANNQHQWTFPLNFGEGFGEGGIGEHSEDLCPHIPIEHCTYPCMKIGSMCVDAEMMLQKAHEARPQSESHKGLTSVEVLYCLWGITTGLVVGVGYSLWSRKKESGNLDHYERA